MGRGAGRPRGRETQVLTAEKGNLEIKCKQFPETALLGCELEEKTVLLLVCVEPWAGGWGGDAPLLPAGPAVLAASAEQPRFPGPQWGPRTHRLPLLSFPGDKTILESHPSLLSEPISFPISPPVFFSPPECLPPPQAPSLARGREPSAYTEEPSSSPSHNSQGIFDCAAAVSPGTGLHTPGRGGVLNSSCASLLLPTWAL